MNIVKQQSSKATKRHIKASPLTPTSKPSLLFHYKGPFHDASNQPIHIDNPLATLHSSPPPFRVFGESNQFCGSTDGVADGSAEEPQNLRPGMLEFGGAVEEETAAFEERPGWFPATWRFDGESGHVNDPFLFDARIDPGE